MAQKHNSYEEKPMTRFGTVQGPSRRYRRLRNPNFDAAEWTAKNPLLQRGEFGIEKDTHRIKAGDGITYWNDLPYTSATTEWGYIQGDIDDQTDLKNALDAKQDVLTAGTNINISGSTISATDTTYTGSDGITLTGTNFTNSGVRSVATGTSNGTISVNTNGTSADVAVYGLGSAAYTASSDYATSAQGSLADTAVQPADLTNYVTTNTTQTISGEKTFSGIMNYSAGKTYILAGNGGTKLGYWSYDIDGQSNITLQTMTASTRNINFKTNNGGKVTYNGSEIAKLSDLPGVMTGASAGDAGTSGLVPAPAAGDQAKFLQGDGTWANPTAATAWGNITGTLSDQTDLQSALNAKQDALTAGSNINISGSTISATDTTYTGSDGITLTGTNFTNSGVRSVATGSANGTISVNTNGTTADVSVTGLGSAAYTSSSDYATSAQGGKADTAVQPGDLATVATTGDYDDLLNKPTIMTGASAGDAGASGLVPAPAAGDQAKFLQGDGTWANPTAAMAWGNITGTLSNQTDLQNALNAKADDNAVVHLAGAETITGLKTISMGNGISLEQETTGTASGAYTDLVQKINGDRRGTIRTTYNSDGSYTIMLGNNGPSGSAPAGISVTRDASSTWTYSVTPTDTTSTSSNQIATVGWANSTGNNILHLSDSETITGDKTFKGVSAYFQSSGSTAYKGFLRKNAAGDLIFGIHDSSNSNWQNYITFYTSNYTRVFGSYLQAPNSDTIGSVVTTVDKSKGSSGFFKLGNGLIVQWGAVNASSSGVAVTLPTAFSSATSYRVVACREANNATMYVSAVRTSASKITVYTSNATAYGIAWIAIGY